MTAATSGYKKLLSSKWASVSCFIIALLAKLALLRIFLDIGTDKSALILATRNMLSGKGISIDRTFLNDLSSKIFEPFIGWPPGYPILLSPLLAIFKNTPLLATYFLDGIAALIFLWYLRKLLLIIGFPVWCRNLFLLFEGFFINNYISFSHPTDFLALSLFVAGIYSTVNMIWKSSIISSIPVVLFFLSACLVRYQYMPVILLMFVVIVILGIINNKPRVTKAGILSFTVIAFFIGIVLLYQKFQSGNAFYLPPAEKGFYPANLVLIYPFAAGSFININFYALQAFHLFKRSYMFWIEIARWISILSILIFLWASWKYFLKNGIGISKAKNIFYILGGISCLATIGLLVVLSLINDSSVGPPLFVWTYVMDARYYAFLFLFIQIILWDWLFSGNMNNILIKIFKGILALIIILEITHSAFFISRQLSRGFVPVKHIIMNQPEMAFTIRFINETMNSNPGQLIVITSLENQFQYIADWYGGSGLFTPLELNTVSPMSKRPAILLTVIRQNELFLFTGFLRHPGVRYSGQAGDFHFYSLYVPGSRR